MPQADAMNNARRNYDILLGADTVDFRMTTSVGGSYASESCEPRDVRRHCRDHRIFCFGVTELKTMVGG